MTLFRSGRRCALLIAILAGSAAPGACWGDDGFAAWCAARAADAGDATVIRGRDGWLFLTAELRHLGAGRFWGEDAARAGRASDPAVRDPLPAILDFHRQLEEMGVRLLIVPVPPKALVYSDMLGFEEKDGASVSSPALDAFYTVLRAAGIDVLDLTPAFLRERRAADTPLYCATDTHWSGRGCEVAAAGIREVIEDRGWIPATGDASFAVEPRSVSIQGDLQRMLGAEDGSETIPLRVVRPGGDGLVPAPDPESPVLLLGDSYTLVFHAGGDMHAGGAGLAEQLALELGRGIDVLGVRGSGATPARISLMRRARRDPDYLPEKKIVIWCFGAREFTEADGWRKVPLTR